MKHLQIYIMIQHRITCKISNRKVLTWYSKHIIIIIIIINLLSWQIFPTSGGWPVLSLLSFNPPYPLHPVAPLFFMSSSTTSIHCFTGLPLFLRPIFNSNTFFISTSSSLTICPNHRNLFCLKCSSRS